MTFKGHDGTVWSHILATARFLFTLENISISAETLTDDPVSILIPLLMVDQQNVNRHLAIEQNTKFDLEQLINQTLMSQNS
jgi:hypothetical protein